MRIQRSIMLIIVILSILLLIIVVYCEWLIYYVQLRIVDRFACSWPSSSMINSTRLMILADTHLLGIRNGHWFDKLRREWQMHRSFQTAIHLLRPDIVVFLGDIFDEGQWSSRSEFDNYSKRFDALFAVDENTRRIVLAGNHDIGFHYEIMPSRVEWFSQRFNRRLIDLIDINGINFVIVTSMAMHGDHCQLCHEAEMQLDEIAQTLNCSLSLAPSTVDCAKHRRLSPSRPIILQHFPLYRKSDTQCIDDGDDDRAPAPVRTEKFREKWDCVSRESTDRLLSIQPRAVFGGHTHYGCRKWWPTKPYPFWEYTVSSFSWRNINQPTFMLLTASSDELAVAKCHLPKETTVIAIYTISAVILAAVCLLFACSSSKLMIQRCYRRYHIM